MGGKVKKTVENGVVKVLIFQDSPKPINFKDLLEMASESRMGLGEIIGYLEMDLVPMTESVRKIGIATGYLYE